MIYKDNEELKQACLEWQKVLRLQDWIVDTRIARARDMPLKDTSGVCSWNIDGKEATISIVSPTDFPDTLGIVQDMEKTLVHELLHLHYAPFDSFDSASLENKSIEQSINCTAMALVTLKRG